MLAIDVREACSNAATGKAQWARYFTEEVLRREVRVHLLAHHAEHSWLQGKPVLTFPGMRGGGFAWHAAAARAARRLGAVYVSPTSYIVPAFAPRSLPTVAVIHDLIAFRGEPHAWKPTIIERLTLPLVARRSSLLCTISAATQRDVLARYPFAAERTATIGAGPVDDDVASGSHDLPAEHRAAVICIATLCPRKNQLRLVRAHAALPLDVRERHPLLLIGQRGWHDAEIVRLAQTTPFVHWLGFVPDAALGGMLDAAAALAYPSLYEGFGMPLLTAFRRGIPALTAAGGSLAEVAKDAALIVDPLSVDALRDGLHRILTDESLRASLRERGHARAACFSWSATVDAFLEAARAHGLISR